ncbi:MAG: hypothetical protein CM15mP101_01750 [Flavobacteriaceae bacterium]|nr:MAG: hypothetical protein CM15mP101_01750 [Flavobacteriaceae bacterium]
MEELKKGLTHENTFITLKKLIGGKNISHVFKPGENNFNHLTVVYRDYSCSLQFDCYLLGHGLPPRNDSQVYEQELDRGGLPELRIIVFELCL